VSLLRRAVRFELGTWRAFARWVARRPDVPPDARAFAYHLQLVAPAVVMAGLSLVEIVAVDLLVPWPWTWLRVAVLAVGVWGAVLTLGIGAAVTVYPHLVTPAGLRVRAGAGLDLHVPWDAVAGIRTVRREHAGIRAARVDDGVLSVGVGNATNVAVTLGRPLTAHLPRTSVEVTAVHLHADDARALMAAARSRLAERATGVSTPPAASVTAVDLARQLESVDADGHRIAAAVRARPDGRVVSCPDWSGADLLAHVTGFARYLTDLFAGRADRHTPFPVVPADEAARTYDADLARLVATLRATPPDAPVPNWAAVPEIAASWQRRAVHELAVHRWDAETIGGDPAPVPPDVAEDGIAEFFEVFVATGIAAGLVPAAQVTLVLEATDTGTRRVQHLPDPGPVTTLRGTASDLLLALWRRRDPLALHVDGPRTPLERWPSI
jgi:uncharacterized protein (TIGR03083 family)